MMMYMPSTRTLTYIPIIHNYSSGGTTTEETALFGGLFIVGLLAVFILVFIFIFMEFWNNNN